MAIPEHTVVLPIVKHGCRYIVQTGQINAPGAAARLGIMIDATVRFPRRGLAWSPKWIRDGDVVITTSLSLVGLMSHI